MANLLASPERWTGLWGDGPPPTYWTAEAYVQRSESWGEGQFRMTLSGASEPGDTLSGVVRDFFNDSYGDTLEGHLSLLINGAPIDSAPLTLRGETPFEFTVPAGAYDVTLLLSSQPFGTWPNGFYGLVFEMQPAAPDPDPPAELVSYNCECEGDADRPQATLGELMGRLASMLGFLTPQELPPPRTLADLRMDILRRLGRSANALNPGQGMAELIDSFINDAQQSLANDYGMADDVEQPIPQMVEDGDTTTLNSWAVFSLALGLAKAHYNDRDAELYLRRATAYVENIMRRAPPGYRNVMRSLLQNSQEFLHLKVASFRQSRYYRWPLEQGVRFYDFSGNDDTCPKKMLPELVEWVGISMGEHEGDGDRWRPLIAGIPPTLYSGGVREQEPQRYEFRQCIELWPAPDASKGYLRIKGKFGLTRFEEDSDTTTIDPELVFMLALANGKRQYGARDADAYSAMVQSRIGDIIAGSHHTRRYIPGEDPRPVPAPPRMRDGYLP